MIIEKDLNNKFMQFMNIHWLRPEAGFFKIYDYSILQNLFPLPQPSIDLCCGDGITSYIWAGGEFDTSFDMYQSVNEADIYEKDLDTFDCFDYYEKEAVKPSIIKKPDWHFDCGLDLKETLVDKAKLLNFYDRTVVHDLSDPMPFKNEFMSAFSTTIWGNGDENQCQFRIKEVNKILKKGGKFVFRVHETKFKEMMFLKYYEKFGFNWAKRLDRYMYVNNPPESMDINWWIQCLEENGFRIINNYNYVPRLIIWFYLTGFRPMFTSFMKMYRFLIRREMELQCS